MSRSPTESRRSRLADTSTRSKPTAVGVIGAGRVGSALAWHCSKLGYRIAGIYDRIPQQVFVTYGLLKQSYRRFTAGQIARSSDVLFVAVPDGRIRPVYTSVRRWLRRGTVVVHCSGAAGVELFVGARERGISTLAMHPIQTFSSHLQAIRSLPGTVFALEGSADGLRFGRTLIRRLGGSALLVAGSDRPLYHLMCVFASNLQNAVLEGSGLLANTIGINRRQARKLLAPLARTAVDNWARSGPIASLTGPVERGDVETVASHVRALAERVPELTPLYVQLSRRLVALARRKGLDRVKAGRILEVLDNAPAV